MLRPLAHPADHHYHVVDSALHHTTRCSSLMTIHEVTSMITLQSCVSAYPWQNSFMFLKSTLELDFGQNSISIESAFSRESCATKR